MQSARSIKRSRSPITTKRLAADEHLLFLFCSLVNPLIGLILLFLCLSVSPPLFQFVIQLLALLFTDLFIADITNSSFIHLKKKYYCWSTLVSSVFFPFPFAARSPGEQEWLGKRCKISLSLSFLKSFFCICIFLSAFLFAVQLVCSAVSV